MAQIFFISIYKLYYYLDYLKNNPIRSIWNQLTWPILEYLYDFKTSINFRDQNRPAINFKILNELDSKGLNRVVFNLWLVNWI